MKNAKPGEPNFAFYIFNFELPIAASLQFPLPAMYWPF
jgi:hypothetical protein